MTDEKEDIEKIMSEIQELHHDIVSGDPEMLSTSSEESADADGLFAEVELEPAFVESSAEAAPAETPPVEAAPVETVAEEISQAAAPIQTSPVDTVCALEEIPTVEAASVSASPTPVPPMVAPIEASHPTEASLPLEPIKAPRFEKDLEEFDAIIQEAEQTIAEPVMASPVSFASDIRTPDPGETSMEEVLSSIPFDTEENASVGFGPALKGEENMSEPTDSDSNEGTLSLKLSGRMTLKLQYDFEGQEVSISFGDGAMKVELADGTEFKVPVSKTRSKNLKRVA